jgi:hypothetical protein
MAGTLLGFVRAALYRTLAAPFNMLRAFILLRFAPPVISRAPLVVGELLRQHQRHSSRGTDGSSSRSSGGHGEAPPLEVRSTGASVDCTCYFTENFYTHSPIMAHFSFNGTREFEAEHGEMLDALPEVERDELIASLEAEARRRRSQAALATERKARIAAEYAPLHPDLWTLREAWLHDDFVALVRGASRADGQWRAPEAIAAGVYALPVFSERFCELLCAELDAFARSGLPCGQPNSMNRFGCLLDELGFSPGLIDPLIREWVRPLCAALPPLAAVGGASLDRHKTFVVAYRIGEDEHLSEHFDNAEVTLNVNLGVDFEGGELVFYGHRLSAGSAPQAHHEWEAEGRGVGHGVLHLGAQVHAALPIASGLRRNLVVWMRSRAHRQVAGCPMCGGTDRLILSS